MNVICRIMLVVLVVGVVLIFWGCGKFNEGVGDKIVVLVVFLVFVVVVLVLVNELLKVVFVYVGLVGDVGWIYVYDVGCKEVEVKFGDKVKISFVENVFESVVDVECVFCDLVI